MIEATLCEIIDGENLLLKRASRGVSRGKWNGLGGKIEENETVEESLVREVFEESGLIIKTLLKHGEVTFFKGGSPFFKVHIFSTKKIEGSLRQSDEGEIKWFNTNEIPYEEMWPDDKFWLPALLDGKKFEGVFYFDEKMKEILKYKLEVEK